MLKQMPRIQLVAPSSLMSKAELELGVERLRAAGLDVRVARQCRARSTLFAGTDEERALALYEAGLDASTDAIWCARGGYGGVRLIPHLERLARERGAPLRGKRLVGYSDLTALAGFLRERWGWSIVHSSMPGLRSFLKIPEKSFRATVDFALGREASPVWQGKKLKSLAPAPALKGVVEAELFGGNLIVLASLVGTPYLPSARGKILFLEEIDERPYRMDRAVQQLVLSGSLEGVQAIVLGTFTDCHDAIGTGLKRLPKTPHERRRMVESPKASDLAPLRPLLSEGRVRTEIFGTLGRQLGIPVFHGLPCGHGSSGQNPLPLFARYRLGVDGEFRLLDWDGFDLGGGR